MQKLRWFRDRPGGHISACLEGPYGTIYDPHPLMRVGLKKSSRKKQRRQHTKVINEWRAYMMAEEAVCPYCHEYCDNELACQDEYDQFVASELLLMAYYEDEWERNQEEYYYDVLCDEDTTWCQDPYFEGDWVP